MKILFLVHPVPNYVPDLLLHGLRQLLGPAVVDHPRKDCLHAGYLGLAVSPPDQLAPGWFPNDGGVERDDVEGRLQAGYFDLVVADIRALALRPNLLDLAGKVRLVLVDGEDRPVRLRLPRVLGFSRESQDPGGPLPLPMALPGQISDWIARHDGQERPYSVGFFGSISDPGRERALSALQRAVPDALVRATPVPAPGEPNPAGRLGRDDYYRLSQQCRVLLTLRGAGADTFRFWENSACGAMHLAESTGLRIPGDFQGAPEIFRFSGSDDMLRQLGIALQAWEQKPEERQAARRHLLERHLTVHRAQYLLDQSRAFFSM